MIKFSCIILSGGKGTRFGGKKQNVIWNGKPLWRHVYDKCIQVSDDVIVVGHSKLGRQGAVYNGLKRAKYNRVVILEAARPCVTKEQIEVIAHVQYPSVTFVIKSVDTIYYESDLVKKHLNRNHTMQLQVPQAFDKKLLIEAHEKYRKEFLTSDTELMEKAFGIHPYTILGGMNLRKVTFKNDLDILEVIFNDT